MTQGLQSHSKVLVIANHKGGVGKTSTALNLACAFAATNRRILLIDMDPQGSSTAALRGYPPDDSEGLGAALLNRTSLKGCIRRYEKGSFDYVPSDEDLTVLSVLSEDAEERELRLHERLQEIAPSYDIIIIDSPPALNLLTVNSLCAGDFLMVPLTCDCFAVEGLKSVLDLFASLKRKGLSRITFLGAVRVMFDRRHALSKNISDELKRAFGTLIFTTAIPFTSRISEAPASGRPVILYDKSSIGAKGYLSLAGEALNRMKRQNLR